MKIESGIHFRKKYIFKMWQLLWDGGSIILHFYQNRLSRKSTEKNVFYFYHIKDRRLH